MSPTTYIKINCFDQLGSQMIRASLSLHVRRSFHQAIEHLAYHSAVTAGAKPFGRPPRYWTRGCLVASTTLAACAGAHHQFFDRAEFPASSFIDRLRDADR